MTLVRASAEAIQRGAAAKLSPENHEALADILLESDRMSGLVNDLLTLARLDEGRLETWRRSFDLADTLREAARWARASARGRDLNIEETIAGGLPVDADPEQLLRVVRGLLDNAIRCTPDGGRIQLAAAVVGGDVQVSLTDTGPGLTAEELDAVFDRFYRVDKVRSHGAGGTGLGLAIAKGIIEAHGGRIWAVSAPARGATFFFTVPLAPS